jgi:hypothetical protein
MKAEKKKRVTLTFKREEILYDCRNYAYIEGDTMKTADEHDRHQVMDVGEDGNIDRVTRVLDLAFADCVELCYPYSKTELEDETALDDTLQERDALVLHLLLPEGFSQTTAELLRRLIHELLVYRVMADWTSHTKPESETKWAGKAEEVEGKITSSLNSRIGRVRRTLTPFG